MIIQHFKQLNIFITLPSEVQVRDLQLVASKLGALTALVVAEDFLSLTVLSKLSTGLHRDEAIIIISLTS